MRYPSIMNHLRTVIGHILLYLLALAFFIEETLWYGMTAVMQRFGRLPLIRDLESRIRSLPPSGAMVIFLLPWLSLLPVKLFALYLIGSGHAMSGVAVIIAAKVAGTAFLARLFALCRPALLTWVWFARLHDWVLLTRDRLYAALEALPSWRAARAFTRRVRVSLAVLLARIKAIFRARFRRGGGRRWRALRRLARRMLRHSSS